MFVLAKDGSTSFRRRVYDLLEANNYAGMVLEALLVLLIILNVLCFMLSTEGALENSDTASMIFDTVEVCTVRMKTQVLVTLYQRFHAYLYTEKLLELKFLVAFFIGLARLSKAEQNTSKIR